MKLSDFTIKARLLALAALAVLAMLVVGIQGLRSLAQSKAEFVHYVDNDVAALTQLAGVRAGVGNLRRYWKIPRFQPGAHPEEGELVTVQVLKGKFVADAESPPVHEEDVLTRRVLDAEVVAPAEELLLHHVAHRAIWSVQTKTPRPNSARRRRPRVDVDAKW